MIPLHHAHSRLTQSDGGIGRAIAGDGGCGHLPAGLLKAEDGGGGSASPEAQGQLAPRLQ